MKKYLFVIPTLSSGGAERVVAVLSTAISEKREVVVLKYHDTEADYDIGDKVKVINLAGGNLEVYKRISLLKKIRLIRKIISEENPDYVIPFLFPVALCVELATIGLKVKVFQSMRVDPASAPKVLWQRRVRDFLVHKSKCTFVQNSAQKEYFKKSIHKKIHVLFNPVSESLFQCNSKTRNDIFSVCAVGRLEKQKNFPLLIDSFKNAFQDVPDAELRIYGTGSQQEHLQSYIDSLKLSDKVYLMGRSNNMSQVFENTDLFVLSSDFEGMPNALMEAMASGLPCISTDCPTGPSDLIINGKNGILVPVNDKEAMSSAMKALYYDEALSLSMGKEARIHVRNICSADVISDKFIEICESV